MKANREEEKKMTTSSSPRYDQTNAAPLRSVGGAPLSRENPREEDDAHVAYSKQTNKDGLPMAYPSSQRMPAGSSSNAANALSTGFNHKQGAPLGANVLSVGGSST